MTAGGAAARDPHPEATAYETDDDINRVASPSSGGEALEAAREYVRRGWSVVAVHPRSKRPIGEEWQKSRLGEADLDAKIGGDCNVGVLLGEPSGGLVDVDLDTPEAVRLARHFLPPTGAIFGRESSPRSHWLFLVPEIGRREAFGVSGDDMIVEIRSTGGQTVFPGSVHSSGEPIRWDSHGEPAEVGADDLRRGVIKLAIAAILRPAYPSEGTRHEFSLAVGGALARSTRSEAVAVEIMSVIARDAGDEEWRSRENDARTSFRRVKGGDRVKGWPTLARIVGDAGADAMRRWLDTLKEPEAATADGEHADSGTPGSRWDRAIPAEQLLAEQDEEADWLVEKLAADSSVVGIAAPRGVGKSHVILALIVAVATGGTFLGRRVRKGRVLLIDTDNSRRETRRRLRRWRGTNLLDGLKYLSRDDAPKLTDANAWGDFPFGEYDLVVLDALGSSTEGVEENRGGQSSAAFAPIVDLARQGPAVVVLLNVPKDGKNYRGSGVIADRVDVLYEVRDVTGLRPSPKGAAWWSTLAEAGEAAWQDRAVRRKRRDDYRLAFVPTKFRLGEEPEPFAVELRLPASGGWNITDVTEDLEKAHETARESGAADGERERENLRKQLGDIVHARHQNSEAPMPKSEAEEILRRASKDVTVKRARALIEAEEARPDARWCLRQDLSARGRPWLLEAVFVTETTAKNVVGEDTCETRGSEGSISDALVPQGRREYPGLRPLGEKDSSDSRFPTPNAGDTYLDEGLEVRL